jgi:tRNA (uracil-5-)-methyltransferase
MSSAQHHSPLYQQQLVEKIHRVEQLLTPFNAPALDVITSEESHYRMRAEFRVWHDGDDLYHIMFNQETREPYRVDTFPAACQTINSLMGELISAIKPSQVLRKQLFQIDYLSGLSNEIVVSLLYHRQLDDQWVEEITKLKNQLSDRYKIHFIGRARKQKLIIEQDFIIETLPINKQTYVFKHIENSFTQPNAKVNCQMIEWAIECSKHLTGDLLELYCGAGNFSLPLAKEFNRVVGTEIAKPSVAAAQFNIAQNKIDNVEIVRLSAEEFVEAMEGKRKFSRLQGIDLTCYEFNTVLVDPPRAGLDPATLAMVSQFDNIIYISCNPESLSANLEVLSNTHSIRKAGLFDQFPFTHHVEAGVWLEKKNL